MRYTREDGCRAWLTYALLYADVLHELLEEYGSAQAIYDRFVSRGSSFLKGRVSEYGLAQLKEHSQREQMHQMLLTMQRLDMGILPTACVTSSLLRRCCFTGGISTA